MPSPQPLATQSRGDHMWAAVKNSSNAHLGIVSAVAMAAIIAAMVFGVTGRARMGTYFAIAGSAALVVGTALVAVRYSVSNRKKESPSTERIPFQEPPPYEIGKVIHV